MKIVILGAGRVGESVAEHLVSERNDIAVVDENAALLADLQEHFDLLGVVGDAIVPDVLESAGAAEADVLLACTGSDATNLVACKLAQQRFATPVRIARLQADPWKQPEAAALLGDDGFGVQHVLCPESSVARAITRLVRYPEALQVRDMADGHAALVSARATAGAPLTGRPLADLAALLPGAPVQICALYRRFADAPDRFLPVDAQRVVEPGDEVYFFAATDWITQALRTVHLARPPARRVMIVGGGDMGLSTARALQGQVQVKLIEADRARSEVLATELDDSVLVLLGDGTDEELLQSEDVEAVDLFCAMTDDDEDNIMSGLLARQLGASRVLALVNRSSYANLVHGTQIDIALSPAQVVMGELLMHLRQGDMRAVYSVRRGSAEAIEVAVHGTPRSSRVVGRRVADLGLPLDTRIGLVVRGLPADAAGLLVDAPVAAPPAAAAPVQVLAATPDTVIEAGDRVLLFIPHRRHIRSVEQLFRVRPTLF